MLLFSTCLNALSSEEHWQEIPISHVQFAIPLPVLLMTVIILCDELYVLPLKFPLQVPR